MNEGLARQTGRALLWQSIQHGGFKAIFLVRLLILARLLSPEDFGLLAIAIITVEVLAKITDFGIVPALIQRTDVDERFYHVAWTLGVIRASMVTAVAIVAAPFVAHLFVEPRVTEIIQVLAICPLIDAASSIKLAELTRKLHFRSLTLVRLPEALASTVIAIALAPYFGVWALVAGSIAGATASLIASYYIAPYNPKLLFDRSIAAMLLRFGRWIFATGLIAILGSLALRLVISRKLGVAELGLYFLAARLAFFPAEVASQVIGAVTFPLYARLQLDINKARQAFQAVVVGLAALLLPVCALILALAPSLVQDVLGSRWEGAAPVIQLLCVASMVGLFGESIEPILKGVGQPYKITQIEGIQSVILVFSIGGLAERYGVVGAAIAWLLAIAVSQILSAKFVRGILPQPFSNLGLPISVVIFVSGIGAVFAIGTKAVILGIPGILLAAFIATVVMGTLLLALDRWLELGLTDSTARAFPQIGAWMGTVQVDR